MTGFVVSGRGRLARPPTLGSIHATYYTDLWLLDDHDEYPVVVWFHVYGETAKLIHEHLQKGDSVTLKAMARRNFGKLRLRHVRRNYLLVVTEIEIDDKVFVTE
jgi:hypothetical protein